MMSATTNRNGDAPPPLTIPRIMSDDQRQEKQDALILNMLGGLEDEELRLDTLQLVNRHKDGDTVPNEARSYVEARDQIAKSRDQLAEVCGEAQMARINDLIVGSNISPT